MAPTNKTHTNPDAIHKSSDSACATIQQQLKDWMTSFMLHLVIQKVMPNSTWVFSGNSNSFQTKFVALPSTWLYPMSNLFSITQPHRGTSPIFIMMHSFRACLHTPKICLLPPGSLHPINLTVSYPHSTSTSSTFNCHKKIKGQQTNPPTPTRTQTVFNVYWST